MFERKKVSHSEKKTGGSGSGNAIKMNIPSIDGLDVDAAEEIVEEEDEIIEEKKTFVSFFKNLSLGSTQSQKQSQTQTQTRGGCGCFSK
jgi:hypothetical protein